jgi:adenylylsulfate kinase
MVTFMTSLLLTGNVALSASIGIVDSTFKIFTYYLFDVVWLKLTRVKYRKTVVFLTGLSGAGKTTIAKLLFEKLQKIGEPAMMLDGDEIREIFKTTGFDKKSRDEHVKNVGRTAAFLQRRGTIAIVSMIAPYSEVRKECRDMSTNFTEVYVNTTLKVCEDRDVKGLYKKARAGEIKSFTGIHDDAPYEVPVNPELTLDTTKMTVDECVDAILTELKRQR